MEAGAWGVCSARPLEGSACRSIATCEAHPKTRFPSSEMLQVTSVRVSRLRNPTLRHFIDPCKQAEEAFKTLNHIQGARRWRPKVGECKQGQVCTIGGAMWMHALGTCAFLVTVLPEESLCDPREPFQKFIILRNGSGAANYLHWFLLFAPWVFSS